jgi:hypothetical protein
MSDREWTDDDLDRLRALDAAGRPAREIAQALDRSEEDIEDRLRIVRARGPKYSGADEEGDFDLSSDAVSDDPAGWISTGSTMHRGSR